MAVTISNKHELLWWLIFTIALVAIADTPKASAQFEMSSKKECALCHIMWMDEFRTNKETLIQWQPGNVLMKDTQGIVSAEEVCYSCHDGYVGDSRFSAWKDHNHPVFQKPSKDMTIPASLPLSNKDEIYCGTCHSPHSGREAVPGASPEETIPGPLAFLRLPNINSGLCEACHVNRADYRSTNGHPLHVTMPTIPEVLLKEGSVQGKPVERIICETCHKTHGAKGSRITVMANNQSGLCMVCHKERTITGSAHGAESMPGVRIPTEPIVSESGPCGICHGVHQSTGFRLMKKKGPSGNPATQLCLSCHNGDPASGIKSIGSHSHPIGIAASGKNGSGNTAMTIPQGLPLYDQFGAVLPSGSIQCFTCHDIHQWDPADAGNRGGPNVEGDASNSFLRIRADGASPLCTACHADKQSLLSFDHNLTLTAPQATNSLGKVPRNSGACGACHLPHNAMDQRLWAREIRLDHEGKPEYCRGCHSDSGPANAKQIRNNSHPSDIALNAPDFPPPTIINGTLPLFNPEGGTENGDRIGCRTCHEVHAWSAAKTFTPSDNLTANQEGDARNSFLRLPASPEPALCALCHPDENNIVGTDHDLLVSAPAASNLFGQVPIQSGQCGVCHAAHNSLNRRLQWNQVLPSVEQNQHPMDSLCLSCHSTNGAAAGKTPSVVGHPKGKLITSMLTPDKRDRDYIRIFDDEWKEVDVGDLSCSSCHSYYQWNHLFNGPGPGHNTEGDATNSFLRTSSEKSVCRDCHGETAIWRYLYYHSSQKRNLIKGLQP